MENQTNTQEPINQTPLNPEPVVPETPIMEPELPPQPEPPLQPQAEVFTPPPIINTPPRSSDQQLQDLGISPPQKTSNVFKTIFIIALIIFLLVIAAFAYVYFKDQSNSKVDTSNPSSFDTVKTNPTSIPTSGVTCFLNDKTYQLGESFPSANGCDTCTCIETKQITCTEKICAPTPTITSTATKSATTSAVPKDWKTYTSKTYNALISLPSDWKWVMPGDGSLIEPTNGMFNGDISFGLIDTVSSPDKKQQITFLTTRANINDFPKNQCTTKSFEINNQKVNEIICSNRTANQSFGQYYYEFIGKNLNIRIDNEKTPIINQIISLIKFN